MMEVACVVLEIFSFLNSGHQAQGFSRLGKYSTMEQHPHPQKYF
jgi:hypothetical protein